jgi:hypothetical protein
MERLTKEEMTPPPSPHQDPEQGQPFRCTSWFRLPLTYAGVLQREVPEVKESDPVTNNSGHQHG